MTTQTELNLSPLKHLGADAVARVNAIVEQLATTCARFTWEDVEAELPAAIRAQIETKTLRRNAPGALMRNAMTLFNLERLAYEPAKNPDARGRPIRVYGRAA